MDKQPSKSPKASYSNYKRRRITPSSLWIISKASSWRSSIHRDKKRPSILLLPAEIRNRIMEYVLVPGDIYLPAKPPTIISKARRTLRAEDNIEAVAKRIRYPYLYQVVRIYQAEQPNKYGCQVLATCKQLYCEGYRIFYERNTFHLAPGPLSVSSQYFDNLQAHHRALIKHLAIDTSIQDLTPKFVAGLEARMAGKAFDDRLLLTQPQPLTRPIFEWMQDTLRSKLEYSQAWHGLADLKLKHRSALFRGDPAAGNPTQLFSRGLFIQQQDLEVALDDIGARIVSGNLGDKQLFDFQSCALIEVCISSLGRIKAVGWKVFTEWLQTRASSCIAELEDEYGGSATQNQVWSQDAR